MREALKRLKQLEQRGQVRGEVMLIGWQGEHSEARLGGDILTCHAQIPLPLI